MSTRELPGLVRQIGRALEEFGEHEQPLVLRVGSLVKLLGELEGEVASQLRLAQANPLQGQRAALHAQWLQELAQAVQSSRASLYGAIMYAVVRQHLTEQGGASALVDRLRSTLPAATGTEASEEG